MITPERWRNKPVVTEHVHFTGFDNGGNGFDVLTWLEQVGVEAVGADGAIHMDTRERQDAIARPGDWIVVGTQGEVYPVSAAVHDDKYDRDEA